MVDNLSSLFGVLVVSIVSFGEVVILILGLGDTSLEFLGGFLTVVVVIDEEEFYFRLVSFLGLNLHVILCSLHSFQVPSKEQKSHI